VSIIVNADDFGKSANVNEAIAQAFEKGLINRTTLMVNMPYAREAVKLAKQRGFIDKVGIHLNLTSGLPVTEDMKRDATMCDENGQFTGDFARDIKKRFFLNSFTSVNIARELVAQLDEFREMGGILWHIDSHHHVHTDPSVWRVLKLVIRKYPVVSVRLGRNMYRGGNILMRLYKIMFNASVRRRNRVKPDFFGSMDDFCTFTANMDDAQRRLFLEKNIEIMVHPELSSDGILVDADEVFDYSPLAE